MIIKIIWIKQKKYLLKMVNAKILVIIIIIYLLQMVKNVILVVINFLECQDAKVLAHFL